MYYNYVLAWKPSYAWKLNFLQKSHQTLFKVFKIKSRKFLYSYRAPQLKFEAIQSMGFWVMIDYTNKPTPPGILEQRSTSGEVS